jgi:hypothetical protein
MLLRQEHPVMSPSLVVERRAAPALFPRPGVAVDFEQPHET